MSNTKIINEFEKLLDQLKIEFDKIIDRKEKNIYTFKIRSVQNIIRIIKSYPTKIKKGEELKDIKGVGKGTIARINEILETGKLSEIKTKKGEKKYLKQIDELSTIIGIGRKKAYELITKYNIKSIPQLKKAFKNKKIELPHQVKMGIKYHNVFKENIPRKEIFEVDKYLANKLLDIDPNLFGIVCGSYRRLKSHSNDIDMLITHPDVKTKKDIDTHKNYLIEFINVLKKDKFLVDDMTDKDYKNKYMGFSQLKINNKKYPIRRIDIRYIPYRSYYTALLYFTGSGEFNRKMRTIAEDLGYKLNEYGLYKINPKTNKFKRMHINSEKDVFDILNMEYLPPKNR